MLACFCSDVLVELPAQEYSVLKVGDLLIDTKRWTHRETGATGGNAHQSCTHTHQPTRRFQNTFLGHWCKSSHKRITLPEGAQSDK